MKGEYDMAVINGVFTLLKTGCTVWGGIQVFTSAQAYGAAHKEHNAAEKAKALEGIVGAVIIILAGTVLLPLIQNSIGTV